MSSLSEDATNALRIEGTSIAIDRALCAGRGMRKQAVDNIIDRHLIEEVTAVGLTFEGTMNHRRVGGELHRHGMKVDLRHRRDVCPLWGWLASSVPIFSFNACACSLITHAGPIEDGLNMQVGRSGYRLKTSRSARCFVYE